MTTEVITPYEDKDEGRKRVLHVALSGEYQQGDRYPLALFTGMGAIREENPLISQSAVISSDLDSLLQTIREQGRIPDMLAMSAHQGTLKLLTQIVNDAAFNEIPSILLGGALPTLVPQKEWETLLHRYSGVFLLRGWSEGIIGTTVQTMLGESDPTSITGLENPNKPYIFPVHSPSKKYPIQYGTPKHSQKNKIARVESSRQCDHGSCVFCQHLCPHVWQPYDIKDTLEQIITLNSMGYNLLEFVDEDFIGNDIKRAIRIMESLGKLQEEGTVSSLRFAINMRTAHLSAKIVPDYQIDTFLRAAKKAGLSVIFNGAESYSKTTLEEYRKKITPEDNLRGILRARKHGLRIGQGFIPFHPRMSKQEVTELANVLIHPENRRLIEFAVPQPFGFLHVDVNSPYFERMKVENPELLGDIDWNMLRADAKYCDPSIGLTVAIFKAANSLRRREAKKYIYPTYLGDIYSQIRLAAEVRQDFNFMLAGFSVLFKEYGNLHSILNGMVPIVFEYLSRAFSAYQPDTYFPVLLLNELQSFIGSHPFSLSSLHEMKLDEHPYKVKYEQKRREELLNITQFQSIWEIANAYASHQRTSEIVLIGDDVEQDNDDTLTGQHNDQDGKYKRYLAERTIDAYGAVISRDVKPPFSLRRTPTFHTLVFEEKPGILRLVSRKYEDIIPENELIEVMNAIDWKDSVQVIKRVYMYLEEKMNICAKKLSNEELDIVGDFLQRLHRITKEIETFIAASFFDKQKHFETFIWMLNDLWKEKKWRRDRLKNDKNHFIDR